MTSPRAPPPVRRWRWRVAAAAVLLAVIWLGLFSHGRLHLFPDRKAHPYPRVNTSAGLAMVVRLEGVRGSRTDEPHPAEGDVLAAGRFRFGSGRARLSMLTGVVLDMEGPADLDLIDNTTRALPARPDPGPGPGGGRGFPGARAEFGRGQPGDGVRPERRDRREDARQVFKGRLEAALLNAAGTPQRSFFLDAAQAQGQQGIRDRLAGPATSRPSMPRKTSSGPLTRSLRP